jgi:hypothetical protein
MVAVQRPAMGRSPCLERYNAASALDPASGVSSCDIRIPVRALQRRARGAGAYMAANACSISAIRSTVSSRPTLKRTRMPSSRQFLRMWAIR